MQFKNNEIYFYVKEDIKIFDLNIQYFLENK